MVLFCLGVWTTAGCMQPTPGEFAQAQALPQPPRRADDVAPLESNIVRVNKFFSSDPWLNFEADGTNKIDGVRFAVYLEGAEKPKGVFGTGRIVVTMYELSRDANGEESARQLFEWELPSEKAYPWRARQMTALGWGYGFRLHWDPKLKVEGRLVAFVVKYFREDGRVITSSRQALKVPIRDAGGLHLVSPPVKPAVRPVAAAKSQALALPAPRDSGGAAAASP
jgi:hypothetical protein